MGISLIIHTENEYKLQNVLKKIQKSKYKNDFSLFLHCKNYIPWENEELKNIIISFKKFYAFPTEKSIIESVVDMVFKADDEKILLVDENCNDIDLNFWDEKNVDILYCRKKELINLNLDTKYTTIKWFIADLISQKKKTQLNIFDSSQDYIRYSNKIKSELFGEKIIYVDGGLGDHVMSLPLLEKIAKDVYVCCKYRTIYNHLPIKGFIDWDDELFGGYRRFVYEYGSLKNSKTIIDAFFGIYGYERTGLDVLKYNGHKEKNDDVPNDRKIALICTSAVKVNGNDSNKDWKDIRWFKLVHELKKSGYFVVQVGTKKDNQIPNVDLKFLDRSLPNLASLIENSSIWLTVDTFFHHFAASIKPEVGVCLTPFYNDHAKHNYVTYIEKDCGKNFSERKWWLDMQQPERKECMDLIQLEDVLNVIKDSKFSKEVKDVNVNIGAFYNVNEYNIHLLEFSAKNTKEFTKYIYVNYSGDINDNVFLKLKKLKDDNIINHYAYDSDDVSCFASNDCQFYIKLNSDDLLEKNDVISAVSDMLNNNVDIANFNVVRYFKNLNHTLITNDEFETVLFKVESTNSKNTKIYKNFNLQNLSFTYSEDKDSAFKDFFNNFYYRNDYNFKYKNVSYKVVYKDEFNLDIKGLIKVNCFSIGPMDHCSNWRLFKVYDRFENGINYNLLRTPTFVFERDSKVNVAIMIRPSLHLIDYIRMLRSAGVKVVADYDDPPPFYGPNSDIFMTSYNEILNILTNDSDLITTTNEKLKNYLDMHSNKPVVVFPNIVKEDMVSKKININEDKIILGWYGTEGHLPSLRIINQAVIKILNEFENVYFNLYTNSSEIANLFNHPKTKIITYNSNFNEFQDSLNEIDINLSPVTENYFNFFRSDIRVQLTAYKGIPSVVSNFSEYKKFALLNGGALISEDNEWYDKIKLLVVDKEKREDLVKKGTETIKLYYNYKKWCEIKDIEIKKLIN